MELLIVFVLGFFVSFVGSIPPAGVNLTAIRISMEQGKMQALWFSLGAILIEGVLCFIALRFASFIASHQEIDFWIKWIAVPVFLIMGAATLWHATDKPSDVHVKEIRKNHWWKTNFTYGMFVCGINPMQIPFWLAYGTYFYTNGWLAPDLLSTLVFMIGAISGTYLLLYLFIEYAAKVLSRILKGNLSGKRLIGYVFLGLGFFQLGQNLWEMFKPQ
ncbi:MAG TPA: LysE family transporter [Cytophagaceae bacterium]|jgi:threonine/homoserine/homoserine lactone efflux protein|nr:LysE family transporter [Cytophagaceae bacterium]